MHKHRMLGASWEIPTAKPKALSTWSSSNYNVTRQEILKPEECVSPEPELGAGFAAARSVFLNICTCMSIQHVQTKSNEALLFSKVQTLQRAPR